MKPVGSGASTTLGKTPLNLDGEAIDKAGAGSGPLRVQITKAGYRPLDVLITEIGGKKIDLQANLDPAPGYTEPFVFNKSMEKVFEAQQLIRAGRYDEALKLVKDIQAAVPQLSVAYELEGGIQMIKGDKVAAADALRRAVALNPASADALGMLNKVQAKGGADGGPAPASVPAAPAATAPVTGAATPAQPGGKP